jgi:two-component system chemotaxis response regulator CheB
VHELIRSEEINDQSAAVAFPLVMIAASAGGIEALLEILPLLPAHFASSIVIVLHLCPSARYRSVLDEVLRRASKLTIKWAQNGEFLLPSTVYLAPQDHHTIVCADRALYVYRGLKVNRHRPAIDPLFLSAAKHFGRNSIAVVLSGASYDGAEGAFQLAQAGAKVMVQASETSRFFEMAAAVTSRIEVDITGSPKAIAHALVKMVEDWFC